MKKNFIAIILTLIALLIAIFIFIINISNKSFKNQKTDIKSTHLSQNILFSKNDYGVYLVDFENKFEIYDLYYSIGYLQAKDRLWQLDYLRKKSEGKLSEILGEKYVENDIFLRKFDLENKSKYIFKNLSFENKKILKSYVSGINEFINYNNDNLTFEFGFLAYKPTLWNEIDCIKIYLLHYIQNNNNKDNLHSTLFIDQSFIDQSFNKFKKDSVSSNEIKTYLNYINKLKTNLDKFNLSSNFTNFCQNTIYKNPSTRQISNSTTSNSSTTNSKTFDANNNKINGFYSYIKYSNTELPNENYPILLKNNNNLVFINTIIGTPNINIFNSGEKVQNFNSVIYNTNKDFWGVCFEYDKDNYVLGFDNNSDNSHNSNNSDNNDLSNKTNNNNNKNNNNSQKIIYEIDTIKIKNSSNVQFYKKYIISNQNKFCLFDFNESSNDINNNNNNNKNKGKNQNPILEFYWNENNFKFIDNYFTTISQFLNDELNISQENRLTDSVKEFEINNNIKINNIDNIEIIYDSLLKLNKFTLKSVNSDQSKIIDNFNLILKQKILDYNFNNLTNPKISDVILLQTDKNTYFDNFIFSSIKHILGEPKNFLNEKEYNFFNLISKNIKNGKNEINQFILELKSELINEFDTNRINYNINTVDNNVLDFKILNLISKFNNNFELNNDTNNYKFRMAKILVKLLKKYNNNKYYQKINTKLNHKMNENGLNNAFNSDKIEQYGNYNSINYINISKNYNYIHSQSQRYIFDFENKEIYFILAGGMSGDIFSPNFLDQKILWEKGGYIKLSLLYNNNIQNEFIPKFKINSY